MSYPPPQPPPYGPPQVNPSASYVDFGALFPDVPQALLPEDDINALFRDIIGSSALDVASLNTSPLDDSLLDDRLPQYDPILQSTTQSIPEPGHAGLNVSADDLELFINHPDLMLWQDAPIVPSFASSSQYTLPETPQDATLVPDSLLFQVEPPPDPYTYRRVGLDQHCAEFVPHISGSHRNESSNLSSMMLPGTTGDPTSFLDESLPLESMAIAAPSGSILLRDEPQDNPEHLTLLSTVARGKRRAVQDEDVSMAYPNQARTIVHEQLPQASADAGSSHFTGQHPMSHHSGYLVLPFAQELTQRSAVPSADLGTNSLSAGFADFSIAAALGVAGPSTALRSPHRASDEAFSSHSLASGSLATDSGQASSSNGKRKRSEVDEDSTYTSDDTDASVTREPETRRSRKRKVKSSDASGTSSPAVAVVTELPNAQGHAVAMPDIFATIEDVTPASSPASSVYSEDVVHGDAGKRNVRGQVRFLCHCHRSFSRKSDRDRHVNRHRWLCPVLGCMMGIYQNKRTGVSLRGVGLSRRDALIRHVRDAHPVYFLEHADDIVQASIDLSD